LGNGVLGPVARRTVRAGVVETVREAIQQQRLAPGTRLSDSELGVQLGVSHSTVREALHQLTHERLVISSPHRGFFVAGFTIDDMIDLLETRGMLEGRIAEVVAPRLDRGALAQLAAAAAAIRYDDAEPNNAFWESDLAFHQLIVGRCPKTILTELWSTLSSRLTLLELLFHDSFEASLADSRAHHLEYYAGLRTGDPAQARQAAEDHYRNPIERLRRARATGKEGSAG
jgi:DNA-binding GntR family transcriptional regulator